MKKKIIGILIVLILAGIFIVNHLVTFAGKVNNTLYLNLSATNPSSTDSEGNKINVGYGIGDPTQIGGKYIWHITTNKLTSEPDAEELTGTPTDEQKNLYCVNAEYGDSWFGNGSTITGDANKILSYELSYDIQDENDRAALLGLNNEMLNKLLDPETEGNHYKQLLWLFDNFYMPKGDVEIDEFLAKVGIFPMEYEGRTYYYKWKDENKEQRELYPYGEPLTADDIVAIQKMAIWYFTNNTKYDKTNDASWLTISENNGAYKHMSHETEMLTRHEMAMDVYNYLIASAESEDNINQYTEENGYKLVDTNVSINGINTNKQDVVEMTTKNDRYLVGPIIIEDNDTVGYDINIIVASTKGEESTTLVENTDYIYTDKDGNALTNITSKNDLVGIVGGFYISVPRSTIESVKVSVKVSYNTTPKTLWLDGEIDKNGNIILNSEQPLVEITPEPSIVVDLISKPFDLALRKYITAVRDADGEARTITNPRPLDNDHIDLSTLEEGTTATYNHRKDPVVVEDGDEVTYQIRIYNEGNNPGYATKIIDQLPEGLLSSTNNITQEKPYIISKGPDGKVRNQYKLDYHSATNKIELTLVQWPEDLEEGTQEDEGYVVDIKPYIQGNLDYEIIEIKCKVAKTADTKKQIVLTNVAWIDAAYDSYAEVEILAQGQDRDSEPSTKPAEKAEELITKDLIGYIGNETLNNQKDLSQDVYFEGKQDDDDFEKVVIMPVPRKFDLALVKFIVAVSKDQTIEESEYLKEADGTYSREPEVKFDETTGKLSYDFENRGAKNPLIVEPGDYVLYTIRVYNEGEVDGYASLIKDNIPEGLEFVATNDEYNGEWALQVDSEGKQVITTDKFSKEKGADPLNAFNPKGTITNENPDYVDAQVLCKVAEQTSANKVLTNYAQISDDTDENEQAIDDIDSKTNEWNDEEDDQDIEKVKVQYFDLSLRKFITAINEKELKNADGKYERAPKVDVSNLADGTSSTAIYNHSKQPLVVNIGDKIVYTIRVYNEGSINGFASEIKDYLPTHLTYVNDSTINRKYGWNISDDGRVLTTSYLANSELDAFNGNNLDYADVKVECIVSENIPLRENQTNIAEISEYKYNGTTVQKDVDSFADDMISKKYLPTDENLPTYKNDEIENSYVPGNEDDDDFEKIYVNSFDLSLRKFITAVNQKELKDKDGKYEREPVVDITPLKNNSGTTAIYDHSKKPIGIKVGDIVVYTIRVYNEGEFAGTASEVKDYLPPYLTYKTDSDINKTYGWQISDDGRIATTKYLANKEISKFNGETLDYEDLKIECVVSNNAIPHEYMTNIAEISEYKCGQETVKEDRDSESNNIDKNLPGDEELPTYKNDEQNNTYVPGNEDDDDFEKIYVKEFDLALRKFITAVNEKELKNKDGKYERAPIVDVTPLKDNSDNSKTTAIYKHPKKPIALRVGDVIVYTIRVYNEGDFAGTASEVKDYLPPYLIYVEDSEINKKYEWEISDDGRVVTTKYLADKEIKEFNGETLDYEDLQIECKISNNAIRHENMTNIAEISEYKCEDEILTKDIDSESDNINEKLPDDENLPNYKKDEENQEYVPGNEDDDDFEKIYIKEFDLALRKFITQIQDKEITTRVPQVNIEPLKNGEDTAIYKHSKEPLQVHVGDLVIYTIRVYNEGEISGYASTITDDIPEYLEFLPEDSTNIQYNWKMYDKDGKETEKVEEAVKVQTEYLAKEENLIKAFNGETLDYKDVKIAFKVKDPKSNTTIITNYAQISDDIDEDKNFVDDKDSKTDEWNDGEDDQDIEKVKVEYFDLSLLKFVSKVIVIEDGKETITETGYNGHENPEPVVKVELKKKKLNNVTVKFAYGITITNEGDIPGYATKITDYVPEGLTFEKADNPKWEDEGNNVISTKQLEGVLLQPGESKTIEVIFKWINSPDNLSQKTNTAEISEDKNEYDIPDKDSTPNNKIEGEDDIDIAKVILAISTGRVKTYFTLTLGLLTVIATGVILIKKFVI